MALQLKPDLILTAKYGTADTARQEMTEFVGVRIIEALEIILKDLPPQQKDAIMAKVDEVIERVI